MHDPVSRGKGQSLVRAAAYNARAHLVDERTGEVWDYGRKGGLLAEMIYAPKDAPAWSRDLMQLVNHIEAAEKRSDAQLAMSLDIALPHELTLEQNKRLLGDFLREEFSRHGYVAHGAIHAPDHEGDERNIHAHVLVSMRKIGPEGFAATKAEQQENYRNRGAHVEHLREKWERLGNRHLERAGHEPSLDRRSLRERGIDREPEQHRGPTVTAMEREGKASFIGEEIDRRQEMDGERRRLGMQLNHVEAAIIDLQAEREKRAQAQIIEAAAARAEQEAREAAKGRTDDTRPAPQPEPSREEQSEAWRTASQEAAQWVERPEAVEIPGARERASEAPEIARAGMVEPAPAEPEREITHGIERTAGRIFGGLARMAESVLGFFFGDGEPKQTPQQMHDTARANDEAREAEARAAPQRESDERLQRLLDEIRRQDAERDLNFAQRYGTPPPPRETNIDRDRDDGGYERERER